MTLADFPEAIRPTLAALAAEVVGQPEGKARNLAIVKASRLLRAYGMPQEHTDAEAVAILAEAAR